MEIKILPLIGFLSLALILNAQTKRAMIRLEDVGPGSYYETPEGCNKLKAIANYLYSENIPFQIAMIPRYKNPDEQIDRSIADFKDPVSKRFVETLKYCTLKGASIGIHGYTHQFANAESNNGFEFFTSNLSKCFPNCPTRDDVSGALLNRADFDNSQVSIKLKAAFDAVNVVDLKVDWFETPHYQASLTQMKLIESWSGVLYEHVDKEVRLIKEGTENIFSNGTIYVPTSLNGVSSVDDIATICNIIQSYTSKDLASFSIDPALEFASISLATNGSLRSYDANSPLHQLVSCFKSQQFSFVGINSLYAFIPSKRQTNIQRYNNDLLIGDVTGDGISELIFRNAETGSWEVGKNTLVKPPLRVQPDYAMNTYLSNWGKGAGRQPLVGDFNGDKKDDILVYNSKNGDWQVALSSGINFIPGSGSWLKGWGVGTEWIPFTGDFDGDGKDDVGVYNNKNGDWQVALSNGSSLQPNSSGSGAAYWLNEWGVGADWKPLIGDFDGDKKEDILIYSAKAGEWLVALSTGNSFLPNAGASGKNAWREKWGIGQWKPLVGDFNGDHKSDILITDLVNGDWRLCISSGKDFQFVNTLFTNWGRYPQALPLIGNFTGNNKSSILLWNKNLLNGTIDFALNNLTDKYDINQTPTAINAGSNKESIEIYPNPAKDELNILFNMDGQKVAAIYNALGQMILQSETTANTLQFHLKEYKPGVYFVHIIHEGTTSVQKFIRE
jgi:hypothetical protein